MKTNYLLPKQQYKLYMMEIEEQLKRAKEQVERIPKLEKTSQMTYEEWYEIYKHKFEPKLHKHTWVTSWDDADNYR